jgi:FKBP-type peptidyl-prolyl cis-trans isomerase FkpA
MRTAGAQSPANPPEKSPSSSSTTVSKFGANVNELKIVDQKPGTGAEAVSGKAVVVHYTGWLYDPRRPMAMARNSTARSTGMCRSDFFSAAEKVIKGWDEGIVGHEGRRQAAPS